MSGAKEPLITKTVDGNQLQNPCRWLALALHFLVSFLNAMLWLRFSTITDQVASYLSISSFQCDMLSVTFVIAFIPGILLSVHSVPTYGLTVAITYAAILQAFGAALVFACFPSSVPLSSSTATLTYIGIFTGQVLAGLAQPIFTTITSHLSIMWFKPNEQPIANIIANLSNPLGIAGNQVLMSLIFPKRIPDDIRALEDRFSWVIGMHGLAAFLLSLCWLRMMVYEQRCGYTPTRTLLSQHVHRGVGRDTGTGSGSGTSTVTDVSVSPSAGMGMGLSTDVIMHISNTPIVGGDASVNGAAGYPENVQIPEYPGFSDEVFPTPYSPSFSASSPARPSSRSSHTASSFTSSSSSSASFALSPSLRAASPPPSPAPSQITQSVRALPYILRQKGLIYLILAFSLGYGAFNTLLMQFTSLLQPCQLQAITEFTPGMLSAILIASGMLGCVVLGILLSGSEKSSSFSLIWKCFLIAGIALCVFIFHLHRYDNNDNNPVRFITWIRSIPLEVVCVICGACVFPILPLTLECAMAVATENNDNDSDTIDSDLITHSPSTSSFTVSSTSNVSPSIGMGAATSGNTGAGPAVVVISTMEDEYLEEEKREQDIVKEQQEEEKEKQEEKEVHQEDEVPVVVEEDGKVNTSISTVPCPSVAPPSIISTSTSRHGYATAATDTITSVTITGTALAAGTGPSAVIDRGGYSSAASITAHGATTTSSTNHNRNIRVQVTQCLLLCLGQVFSLIMTPIASIYLSADAVTPPTDGSSHGGIGGNVVDTGEFGKWMGSSPAGMNDSYIHTGVGSGYVCENVWRNSLGISGMVVMATSVVLSLIFYIQVKKPM